MIENRSVDGEEESKTGEAQGYGLYIICCVQGQQLFTRGLNHAPSCSTYSQEKSKTESTVQERC